jgi:hypothetical protein
MFGSRLERIDAFYNIVGDILASLGLVVTDDEAHDLVM